MKVWQNIQNERYTLPCTSVFGMHVSLLFTVTILIRFFFFWILNSSNHMPPVFCWHATTVRTFHRQQLLYRAELSWTTYFKWTELNSWLSSFKSTQHNIIFNLFATLKKKRNCLIFVRAVTVKCLIKCNVNETVSGVNSNGCSISCHAKIVNAFTNCPVDWTTYFQCCSTVQLWVRWSFYSFSVKTIRLR